MKKEKRLSFITGETLRSIAISGEILRTAKIAAQKSHQAAILAQEAYNKKNGTHHKIAKSHQRD